MPFNTKTVSQTNSSDVEQTVKMETAISEGKTHSWTDSESTTDGIASKITVKNSFPNMGEISSELSANSSLTFGKSENMSKSETTTTTVGSTNYKIKPMHTATMHVTFMKSSTTVKYTADRVSIKDGQVIVTKKISGDYTLEMTQAHLEYS